MRVLITGAGTGIGRATAQVLTAAGHEVVATARDVTVLDDLDVALRLPLDVTDDESVAACIAAAGEVDVLVNNAGVIGPGPVELVDVDDVRSRFETNVLGPLRMIQAVVPSMRGRGSGVIVNVTSVQGVIASPLEGVYSATKHALEALSEALSYEVGHFGVRVVIIEPGYIAPGMKHRGAHPETGTPYEELRRQWSGVDGKVLDGAERPQPEIVGEAIARAIADPATPLRVPVGADAELIIGTRKALDDAAFKDAIWGTIGLTW